MGFTNFEQLQELFLCGGAGFLIGAYYDVFRLWRLWWPTKRWVVFAQDVVFMLTSAVGMFLLSLAITDGRLRFYVYLGAVAGFFAYRYTVGRALLFIATRMRRTVRTATAAVCAGGCRVMTAIKKQIKIEKKTKKGLETEQSSIV